ncbi:MAG: NfeD family protein, partial [Woeseiaceae bacterium]|nr:NfeD family protein [Woeseiaceae bacterium]
IYGLWFEGYSPGAIVPGVVGVICLLLAAYALQVLPVNYAGLILIIIGVILIIAEAFAPSFGALGLGGLAALVFGSIMMFDSGIPGFGISITFVVSMAIVFGTFLLWLASYAIRLQKRGAISGVERILHAVGVATESFTGEGQIWLEGETWLARSTSPISKDQEVRVNNIDGLVLDVEPIDADAGEEPVARK